MDNEEIGRRIRERRRQLRWSQEELANRFGVQQTTISNYEKGERGLQAIELLRLAQILSVPITYFFDVVIPTNGDPATRADIEALGNRLETVIREQLQRMSAGERDVARRLGDLDAGRLVDVTERYTAKSTPESEEE